MQVRKLELDSCKKPGWLKKLGTNLYWLTKESEAWFMQIPLIALNGKADFEIDLSKSPTLGKGKRAVKRVWLIETLFFTILTSKKPRKFIFLFKEKMRELCGQIYVLAICENCVYLYFNRSYSFIKNFAMWWTK